MRAGLVAALAGASAIVLAACGSGSTPSPTAVASPSPRPSPTASAVSTEPVSATVLVDGTAAGDGQVGSYAVGAATSDAPWLLGTPVTVSSSGDLDVVLGGGRRAEEWTVAYGAFNQLDDVPVGLGDGSGDIAFAAPPPGRWSVQVFARFEGGGSAAFYWDVSVEEP